jgi:hypothetical protein
MERGVKSALKGAGATGSQAGKSVGFGQDKPKLDDWGDSDDDYQQNSELARIFQETKRASQTIV